MTTKFRILKLILAEVCSPYSTKLSSTLENIINQHKLLVEDSLGGFWYKSKAYGSYIDYRSVRPLHESLHQDMQNYIQSLGQFNEELDYINSYITAVLNNTPLEQVHHLLPTQFQTLLKNRGVELNPELPPENLDILKYNQKGYGLFLKRLLLNTVGY